MWLRSVLCVLAAASVSILAAQATAPEGAGPGWRQAEQAEAKDGGYAVELGTRIPLSLINSVSTRHSGEGDRVYLETVFPILVKGRVVIPPHSYVAGTITQVKRPGRVKGRGELFLRFDSLTLPNGVTRDFRARIGGLDGLSKDELDKNEGGIRGEGNKAGDARTVGETAAAGASVGGIAGSIAGRPGMGLGIGAAAGAAAGLMGVLLSRGPDVVLAKGSSLEMVLDRPIQFEDGDLDFTHSMTPVSTTGSGPAPQPSNRRGGIPGRRWPLLAR